MKTCNIITVFAAILLLPACKPDRIQPYRAEDAAVNFLAVTNSFSMKGVTTDKVTYEIPLQVVGPATDYNRKIDLAVKDSTAVQGRDFTVRSAMVPAGELEGKVVLEVNRLKDGQTDLATAMTIVPNEFFIAGFPRYQRAVVSWTELYARPGLYVWRYWYLFFCHGYSQDFHKLLVEVLGEEVEKTTNSRTYQQADPELILRMPDWWYAANAAIRDYVVKYDRAHPDEPLRHSADYEAYTSYNTPAGEGTRPETPPTILETLNNI